MRIVAVHLLSLAPPAGERTSIYFSIEKLCLFSDGVGRDNISDFTTNLIKGYLLDFTQAFAREHLVAAQRRVVPVEKTRFNYSTETWETRRYELPFVEGDYVILTPVDMLTKDDIWINRTDLVRGYHDIVAAIPNAQLRAELSNYFERCLPQNPKKRDEERAAIQVLHQFPEFLEYYVRWKEDHGDEAEALSEERVRSSKQLYMEKVRELATILASHTGFNTPSDVNREVNNGRGPVDYTVSRGRQDKTLVEFKLASNTSLRKNLENQAEIYQKASHAQHALQVIVFFTREERQRVEAILDDLGLRSHPNVMLIDARPDNKPSASKATGVELEA